MLAAVRRALAEAEDFEIVGEVSVGSGVVPAVRETNPNVVLLDMRMPELDGLACLARVRKHDPTIAVVILSSYSDEDQIEAARRQARLGTSSRRSSRSISQLSSAVRFRAILLPSGAERCWTTPIRPPGHSH